MTFEQVDMFGDRRGLREGYDIAKDFAFRLLDM